MSAAAAREAACAVAWRKVPALKDVKPSMRRVGPNRVYTFAKRIPTAPGGPAFRQVVKVTVDADGKVVKVVTGR